MPHIYIGYTFTVSPLQPGAEILIAELGYIGFESFVETEEGVTAYIQKNEWRENILDDIRILKNADFEITFASEEIKPVNWNAAWEKNFSPTKVSENCMVRAPFHEPFNVPYEIIIEPKMSFGTGHHETTQMMLQFLLEHNFEGKTVLDMGCGTAVLAILTEKRGAKTIDAIDIDEWCVENSEENVSRNKCKSITVSLGDASVLISEEKYDVIIANINRNILLTDIPVYAKTLKKNGVLYLSGFYKEDITVITTASNNVGLTFVENKERNNWIAAKFVN